MLDWSLCYYVNAKQTTIYLQLYLYLAVQAHKHGLATLSTLIVQFNTSDLYRPVLWRDDRELHTFFDWVLLILRDLFKLFEPLDTSRTSVLGA